MRDQVEFRTASLDQLLPPEHEARVVWEAVSQLDMSAWLDEVQAVEGHVGRNSTDPRPLVALWVYATLQGEASAREVARLCQQHLAYQWLCGGVTIKILDCLARLCPGLSAPSLHFDLGAGEVNAVSPSAVAEVARLLAIDQPLGHPHNPHHPCRGPTS